MTLRANVNLSRRSTLTKSRIFSRIAQLRGAARKRGAASAEVLMAALVDKSPEMRMTAAELVGQLRATNLADPLLRCLNDRFREVRLRSVESLGMLLRKASPALLSKLRDPDELVRVQTLEAIEQIGDRSALTRVWKVINDRSALVRSYAAATIGALGSRNDLDKIQRVTKTERSARAKVGLLEATYRLGGRYAVSDLMDLTRHQDYRIRCAAVNALGSIDLLPTDRKNVLRDLMLNMKKESTIAVRSSLKNSIRMMRESGRSRS